MGVNDLKHLTILWHSNCSPLDTPDVGSIHLIKANLTLMLKLRTYLLLNAFNNLSKDLSIDLNLLDSDLIAP